MTNNYFKVLVPFVSDAGELKLETRALVPFDDTDRAATREAYREALRARLPGGRIAAWRKAVVVGFQSEYELVGPNDHRHVVRSWTSNVIPLRAVS